MEAANYYGQVTGANKHTTIITNKHNKQPITTIMVLRTKKHYKLTVNTHNNYYGQTTGRRVSFEWTLIAGNNDDEKTAHKLGRLIIYIYIYIYYNTNTYIYIYDHEA